MLTISLRHFRCWEKLDLEIPLGQITLIRGASGSGKTTILQAITWCLYGNIRLVSPNNAEKAATQVIVSFPYNYLGINGILILNRQKGTDNITITHSGHKDKIYTDKEAKQMIIDLFGTYDIWVASCYIGQGCRNSFLTSTNSGKMEFLNNIAFHEEDPSDFIDKISTYIDNHTVDCTVKTKTLQDEAFRIETLMKTIDINKALTNDSIITITNNLNTYKQRLSELQVIQTNRNVDQGILSNLQKQLSQVMSTHIIPPKPDDILLSLNQNLDTVEALEGLIQKYTGFIPILQRRDDLNNEMKKYENIVSASGKPDVIYSPVDYQEAIMKERTYLEQQQLAQTLGVNYREEAVKDLIQYHNNLLLSQDRLKIDQDIRTYKHLISDLQRQISELSVPITIPQLTYNNIPEPDYSKYNTTELSNVIQKLSQDKGAVISQIQQLQKGLDVKQCPACKVSLRDHNGILVHADTGPTNQNEIMLLQNTLGGINSELVKVNNSISSMKTMENNDRLQYERLLAQEQQRISMVKDQIKKLEMEIQRRDITIQSHRNEINKFEPLLTTAIELSNKLPEAISGSKLLSPYEIDQKHGLIARLQTIKFVALPLISSQVIQTSLNYHDMLSKHETAKNLYLSHMDRIPIELQKESVTIVQTYINKIREYWTKVRTAAEEKVRLQRLQISLQEQIDAIMLRSVPDPVPEIMKTTMEIGNLNNLLMQNTKAQEVIQIINKFNLDREKLIELNTELSDLYMFHQHAVETECKILQQVVDNINNSIKDVCSTLFDEDISIMLSLFKTMKTTKNVKPVVNFTISHKGGLYDNITQISGGEGDRASIALTTALNRFSSFPILMFDESLASLDITTKETAITTLKATTSNTVLVIMHDGIEGIFDHVIDIDAQ